MAVLLQLRRRVLRGALWAAASVAGLAAGLVLVVVARPGWLINAETVGWAAETFTPGGVEWRRLDAGASSVSLLRKRVFVRAEGLCLRQKKIRGCFDEVEVALTARLRFGIPRLERVDRLVARSDWLVVDARPEPGARPEPPGPPTVPMLPKLAVVLPRLGEVRLEARRVTVERADGRWEGTFDAVSNEGVLRVLGRVGPYKADVTARSDIFRGGAFSTLDAEGTLEAKGWRVALDAKTQRAAKEGLRAAVQARAVQGKREATADVKLAQDGGSVVADLLAKYKDPKLGRFTVKDCRVRLDLARGGRIETAHADCGYEARPEAFAHGKAAKALPLKVGGRVVAQAAFEPKGDAADAFRGSARISVGPHHGWYEFSGKADVQAKGRLSQLPESLDLHYAAEAAVRVPQFSKIKEVVRGTPYDIPPPFSSMEGPLFVSARGEADGPTIPERVDFTFRTGLAQGKQRFSVTADGTLFGRERLDADVRLQDVALVLPNLEAGIPPKVLLDPRIDGKTPEEEAQAKAKGPALQTRLRVRTEKPALLYSNLAKGPVPVSLDLTLRSPRPLEAKVEVGSFGVEVFRRRATVQHVKLVESADPDLDKLDGLITYETADASIKILLVGTLEKPEVNFESEPPMGDQEVLSALLFGTSPSELSMEEQESVGNANTALAEGAFGLMSLYLFASTPVEYVGFDPTSQSYSVKFRLPGAASLEVGGKPGSEERSVTLRKRLGRYFTLETDVKSTSDTGNVVTTFLEWLKRY